MTIMWLNVGHNGYFFVATTFSFRISAYFFFLSPTRRLSLPSPPRGCWPDLCPTATACTAPYCGSRKKKKKNSFSLWLKLWFRTDSDRQWKNFGISRCDVRIAKFSFSLSFIDLLFLFFILASIRLSTIYGSRGRVGWSRFFFLWSLHAAVKKSGELEEKFFLFFAYFKNSFLLSFLFLYIDHRKEAIYFIFTFPPCFSI